MLVSIIIPIRNEEKFIGKCLDSFLPQIEGRDDVEILCMDGMSTDKTAEIVQKYALSDSRIRLIQNPSKVMPAAMNIGIRQSKGKFLIVAGCHAEYPSDYVDKCLEVFEQTKADQIGAYLRTLPGKDTPVGRAIAAATSSRFGVGAGARVPGSDKNTGHASFGGFRRDVFDRFGFYDERLVRNQDIELCIRIRNGGGKVVMSPEIIVTYYNKSTFAGLRNQAFLNGLWNPYTIWLTGRWLSLKHFVPLGFVLSLLALGSAGFVWFPAWILLVMELLVYSTIGFIEAFKIAKKAKTSGFLVFLAFVQLHLIYGIGSLWGVLAAPFKFGFKRKGERKRALNDSPQ